MLGVGVLAFAPYCVFNYVSPLMTLLVAALGFRIPPPLAVQVTSAEAE